MNTLPDHGDVVPSGVDTALAGTTAVLKLQSRVIGTLEHSRPYSDVTSDVLAQTLTGAARDAGTFGP